MSDEGLLTNSNNKRVRLDGASVEVINNHRAAICQILCITVNTAYQTLNPNSISTNLLESVMDEMGIKTGPHAAIPLGEALFYFLLNAEEEKSAFSIFKQALSKQDVPYATRDIVFETALSICCIQTHKSLQGLAPSSLNYPSTFESMRVLCKRFTDAYLSYPENHDYIRGFTYNVLMMLWKLEALGDEKEAVINMALILFNHLIGFSIDEVLTYYAITHGPRNTDAWAHIKTFFRIENAPRNTAQSFEVQISAEKGLVEWSYKKLKTEKPSTTLAGIKRTWMWRKVLGQEVMVSEEQLKVLNFLGD